jgi:pimeloyl-ACP methyl ester carboxylesterase
MKRSQIRAVRLSVAVLVAAISGAAVVAVGGIRSELASTGPTLHVVPRPAGEPWLAPATDVTLRTSMGSLVRGWFLASRNGAAVLLVHGSNADRTQLLPEARTLSRAGYGVLLFDQPGNGESGGEKRRGDEADFLSVAVDFLATEPGLRPGGIGAYGFSSGAAFLAEAAAKDARIEGVVLAGCYGDDEQYILHYGGRGPLSGLPALWAARWEGLAFPHPLAAMPAIAPRAIFLIAGDRDPTVPWESSRQLYGAAHEPKELWIVHGAGHGGYEAIVGEEYGRRLVAFFDRALLAGAPERRTSLP